MKAKKRDDVQKIKLPGRIVQKVVGKDSVIQSKKMTVGFAHYSKESGSMAPHKHAEETVYIISADKAWVRFGDDKEDLNEKLVLEAGMILYFEDSEWHVFEYENEGYVDILFIYGQIDNIRPEENSCRC